MSGESRPLPARRLEGGLPLGRRVALLVVAAGAVLLASVVASTLAVIHLDGAVRQEADRIEPAATAAASLHVALDEQETGVQAYLVSGDLSLLAPYRLGVKAESSALAQLRADLSGDDSLLGEVSNAVAAATTWRLGYVEPALAAARPGKATSRASLRQGARLFGRFRAAMASLETALSGAHRAASARLRDADHELIAVLAACLLALLAIFEATWVLIRRWITLPTMRLAADVQRVAAGAFEEPISARGPPELRSLAADVDTMRSRIVSHLAEAETARKALERSNEHLEQFAHVASHDLQEPLRKMRSFAELVFRRYGDRLDDRGRELLGFIAEGARRMQRLIRDVLELSRVGSESHPFETVDLNDAVEAAFTNLHGAIAETGAEVLVRRLPRVRGDEALLTALFQNLLRNSLKFRSQAPLQVVVAAERTREGWLVNVDDNGIGIGDEDAERIFAMFQRLHPRGEYPGSGIGLALCQRIVEYHGGRIWLDTTHRPGTRISFTLPAGEAHEDDGAEGAGGALTVGQPPPPGAGGAGEKARGGGLDDEPLGAAPEEPGGGSAQGNNPVEDTGGPRLAAPLPGR
ncbi:MAG TPA: ATP-binding protein [Acidimicrobiales bacterium]|nr:ATP-binding protein [Acidimicrobiales bacterium]